MSSPCCQRRAGLETRGTPPSLYRNPNKKRETFTLQSLDTKRPYHQLQIQKGMPAPPTRQKGYASPSHPPKRVCQLLPPSKKGMPAPPTLQKGYASSSHPPKRYVSPSHPPKRVCQLLLPSKKVCQPLPPNRGTCPSYL